MECKLWIQFNKSAFNSVSAAVVFITIWVKNCTFSARFTWTQNKSSTRSTIIFCECMALELFYIVSYIRSYWKHEMDVVGWMCGPVRFYTRPHFCGVPGFKCRVSQNNRSVDFEFIWHKNDAWKYLRILPKICVHACELFVPSDTNTKVHQTRYRWSRQRDYLKLFWHTERFALCLSLG